MRLTEQQIAEFRAVVAGGGSPVQLWPEDFPAWFQVLSEEEKVEVLIVASGVVSRVREW